MTSHPFLSLLRRVFPAAAACALLAATTATAQVVISEIHYHPVEEAAFDSTSTYNPTLDLTDDVHEFIEIQNTGASAVDLGGWKLSGAVDFTFPTSTSIAAGGYKVIAKDVTRLQTVYSITGVLGPYTGKLSNSGDSIRLKNAADVAVDSVTYSSSFPWAQSANALGAQDRFTGLTSSSYQYKGRSLQRVSATAGSSDPANWLASPLTGPTPGSAQAVTRVVPKPVVVAKSHAQTTDGSTIINQTQAATINCTFSSTASLSAVQLEWFVDLVDSITETHTTTTMTDLGNGTYTAAIPGQAARAIVRYRILANRGDGSEVVSPRADDPAISAVGASNAVQPWHGYFSNPTGRSTTYQNYDLYLSTTNLTTIRSYAQQGGSGSTATRRVTAASAAGLPRSIPWVASTQPLWDGTVPAVFACNGVLYDVQIRFHGSRYHRYDNATNLSSFKLHFPETSPFQTKTSWFITAHGQEFHEATVLNRLAGLPASKTQFVSWYINGATTAATKLQQGEYDGDMLDDYHKSMRDRLPGSTKEETGLLFKDVGNRDTSANSVEGPYTCGDMAAIVANASWTKLQRYEWTYSNQNISWKGPKPFATMLEGMWAARGDTTATHNFSTNATQLANTRAWFNANYDMETTLTSHALIKWMSIWDDAKQNQFYWQRASGKWSRLGWDYDSVMNTSGGGGGMGGGTSQSIYAGEYGSTVFDGVNWWMDTFYKAFTTEYKNRMWWINNSFCDPQNLLAMGFTTSSRCYTFASTRQAQVNTQLGLGTYYKPARPTNSSPAAASTILGGAALASSTYSSPNAKSHLSTKWEIRSASGNYEEPVYAVSSTTNLTTLPVPYDQLTYGQTYYWRVSYNDADGHTSVLSAETSFTWSTAAAVASDLKINEILADNRTIVSNGTAYPDYIELRNNGSSAFDLTGITLTDDVSIPAKYTFPSGNTIAAGGHLIVWCDKDTTSAGIHTGFALNAGGQTVLLMNGATVLDSVVFGPQAPDISIGRITNGTGSWTANVPTPAAANTAATLGTTATLSVNEWMASPAYGEDWFELYNSGTTPVALAGLYLSDTPGTPAITAIPALSYIGAGGYTKFFADGTTTGANHCNFKLSASGESLVLTASNGSTAINTVTFSTQSTDVSQGRLPDGGSTIATFATTASPEKPNWTPSAIVINEVLSNPTSGNLDSIELCNTGASAADIGGWWLSDDVRVPKKFQIPAATSIPAGGYLVFTATQFSAASIPFALSSEGDEACLAAGDGIAVLTGYRSQVSFGASSPGATFGRVAATGLPNGSGGHEFWPQITATLGTANGSPVTTPVILNEIMYHPTDGAGSTDISGTEFIEIHNPSNGAVDLSGWKLKGDSEFTFASGTSLPAFAYALVVNFNPATDSAALATFNSTYSVPNGTALYGPLSAKLANNTQSVEIAMPVVGDTSTNYVNVDKIEYRDISPWATTADGGGKSLQRLSRSVIGNTAANWPGATPTPGALNSGLYTTLAIWSQSPPPSGTSGSPYSFTLVGVGGSPGYVWSLDSGSLPAGITLTSGVISGTPSVSGTFNFTIRLTDSLAATTTLPFTLTIAAGTSATDTDSDGMPDNWENTNGLTVGINDASLDADGDGQSNLAEYLAGTDPQSSASVFAVTSISAPSGGSVTLLWSGVAGKTYQIWSSSNLTTWTPVTQVPCTVSGTQTTNVATSGATALYLRLSVVP